MITKKLTRTRLNSEEFNRLNARIKNTSGYYTKMRMFEKAFLSFQIELKMLKRNQKLLFNLVEKLKNNNARRYRK